VYYSTDSALPRFVPGFAKKALTDMAAKRSTSWVERECAALPQAWPLPRERPHDPSLALATRETTRLILRAPLRCNKATGFAPASGGAGSAKGAARQRLGPMPAPRTLFLLLLLVNDGLRERVATFLQDGVLQRLSSLRG
jgi:hypothetical protein